jgi:DNA-binding CsgD family transcriptional regulator
MEHSLLAQNEEKRLSIPMPLLFCFAMFMAWQMGIIYFSGQTLSFYGRTPLPVTLGNMSLHITVGYILSILFIYFVPRLIVRSARCVTGMALMSALALYLPLPENILLTVFIFHCYCCVFMIGVENAFITYLFKRETAARHLTLAYALAAFIIAFLHNDILPVSFSVFEFFMVFATALLLFFFCKMPAKVWPRYAAKDDGLTYPLRFSVMVFALGAIGALLYLFGSTIAETVPHGLFVFYCAMASGGALVFVIWKRFRIPILRIGYICVGAAVLGFFLALLSLYVPALALPACALISIGGIVCNFIPLFMMILVKLYPARFISPVMISLCLIVVLIHAGLLEALRDNMQFLYIVYIVIAVGLSVLYLALEPHLTFTLREKAAVGTEENSGLRSLDTSTDTPAKPGSVELRQGLAGVLRTHAFDKLTGQELRVSELILRGYIYTEIAKTLELKPGTVKSYQKSIYSKLQINSKRELFAIVEKAQVVSDTTGV